MLRGGELDGVRVLGRPIVELLTREVTVDGLGATGDRLTDEHYAMGWGKVPAGLPGSPLAFQHGGISGHAALDRPGRGPRARLPDGQVGRGGRGDRRRRSWPRTAGSPDPRPGPIDSADLGGRLPLDRASEHRIAHMCSFAEVSCSQSGAGVRATSG